ncbi:protein kinase [Planomonospora parontospora]|uniref:serine/threonine-protein kinase n=1 Tax=Planomonospora parontospora TaxID=58119 RepID=UPI0036077D9A
MPEQQTRVLAGRYELITPLGRGTMGTVWRAHDRSLGREVAIKEIRQEPGLSEAQRAELRERMIREGRTAARISHPSVATVHDAIIEDGSPWIIMELVQARSLEQVVEEEGPLPPRLVAAIGVDLLDALRAAHAQGVLHRDVKPGNVLITESGRVVLTDFGIAKAEGDTSLTQTGMVIGSPGYTAPERARGEHTGPESDLWSLGATLYFAVEGRPAYERSTMAETLAALMTEGVDPPVQAGPLRPVLEQLLEKDHTVRLTPSQAIAMLRAVADTPLASSAPPEAFRPPAPAADGGARSPFHHAAGPGSEGRAGAWAGDGAGSGPGNGTAPDEEFDANRTMMVARPTIGLPLPGTGRTPPAPPAPPVPRPEAGSGVVSGLGTPVARGPSAPDRRGEPGGPAVPGSGTSAPRVPDPGARDLQARAVRRSAALLRLRGGSPAGRAPERPAPEGGIPRDRRSTARRRRVREASPRVTHRRRPGHSRAPADSVGRTGPVDRVDSTRPAAPVGRTARAGPEDRDHRGTGRARSRTGPFRGGPVTTTPRPAWGPSCSRSSDRVSSRSRSSRRSGPGRSS